MTNPKKPSAAQVIDLLEFEYLCEWGDNDHMLSGGRMSSAYMFSHIARGKCVNPHFDWRRQFWKEYRVMKRREARRDER